MAEESYGNRVIQNASYNEQEEREREDQEKMDKNHQYGMDLQQQLVNQQQKRQCDYEETLVEKRMMDDVMRTFADEDRRELVHKREQTEKMRGEMVTFQKAREDWKEKQKEMVVQEEREIEGQRQAASDRSSAIVAERERKVHLQDESNQKIATKMLADVAARQEREDVITHLQEQEYLEKSIQEDITERAHFERVQSETKEALLSQMEYKKDRAREEIERDVDYRRAMETRMLEEDEVEKEKERKAKEVKEQYYADLQKQIQDNAERRQRDKEIEQNIEKRQYQHDNNW